jgi:type II secretory pathway component PulJ
MPPVIMWAIGALGAVALARVLAKAARRVNAELDDIRRKSEIERPVEKLERDPVSGEYRPRKS